jgi:multidrug efflux pump subunit AcrA (membrane-fusion protein)
MSEFNEKETEKEMEIMEARDKELGEKKKANKKDVIKNVAIVFLTIMLILTFFSNTIMNYSLPQVATQQISYGTISPQIRGSGTVAAEDPYNVTVKESRKVSGVAIKEGAHVEIGDVIFYLEDKESEELKTAKKDLDDMELAYEQSLFSGDIPNDVITRVRNGKTSSYDAYQLKLNEVNQTYDKADADYKALVDAKGYLTYLKQHDSNETNYHAATPGYMSAEATYEQTYATDPDRIIELQKIIDNATKDTTQLDIYDKQVSLSYDQKIILLDRQIEQAKVILEKAEKDKNDEIKSINTEIGLCMKRDKIAEQKEKIKQLEAESVGATVKAPVAGIVSSINKAAGESISADETLAVIQIDGKDMTTSFSVTNAQAQKLSIGAAAKPQNAWMFGDDFKATLINIKNDKTDPNGKKVLTFKIESTEVTPGQNIALAIGERSVEYDMVVPLSAIKSGNASKYVLAVKSKSSPLGNRYIASKVDVSVIAQDDTYAAINAALDGDEYVITTSNKMVNPGDQVRLSNE